MTPPLLPQSVLAICSPLMLAKHLAPLEPQATKAQRGTTGVAAMDSVSLALFAFHLFPDLESITKLP